MARAADIPGQTPRVVQDLNGVTARIEINYAIQSHHSRDGRVNIPINMARNGGNDLTPHRARRGLKLTATCNDLQTVH